MVRAGSHKTFWPRQKDKASPAIGATRNARDTRRLLLVKRFAHRRYHSFPNVLAVGLGAKFQRGSPSPGPAEKAKERTCIQFFVTRKRRALKPRYRLPKFVYRRFLNGRVDYRRKIRTDVIPVGAIHAACRAGSHLDANGDHGLITLIFRNKAQPGKPFYLISCAHVAGDIHRSPPAYDELTSPCSRARPFARTLANSTAGDGGIDYDIALAKIEKGALPLQELRIRNTNLVLDSFLPLRSIQQGLGVSVVLGRCSTRGTVDALHVEADVRYGNETFPVYNLFGVNVAADKGDSGGLVHRETQAVGIVVAASPQGWLWFQPLQPAISFLGNIAPVSISVFHPQPLNQTE
jgi:hypothetical protein